MNLIKKLAQAKKDIKSTSLKKEGKNEYSKYDYFTPSQVEHLVNEVCEKNGLLTKFDLIRDALGVTGVLRVYSVDETDPFNCIEFQMATAIPEIKATNIAQQLGGCVTYTERYLKMTAFGITDNNLDFDSDKKSQPEAQKPEVIWLSKEQFEKALASNIKGIQATLKAYDGTKGKAMSKEYKIKLNDKITELNAQASN